MKYDFELSIDEHTSIGKIVRHIQPGSSVLEFGPGNGRMTKYLIDEKACEVSIVEFDEVLFQHVMGFAKDGFLGNIEDYKWAQHFAGKTFDYIVFADVLEHLVDSEKALEMTKPFLAENGEILITFPNLAHNSVLIDLFNNKLDWNRYGLLDKTHNSFYTESGFKKWFDSLDLSIVEQDYTYSQVGQNEIESHYEDLPLAVRFDFETRAFGEVYQYFYALSKKPVAQPLIKQPENSHYVYEVFLELGFEGRVEHQRMLINNFYGENKNYSLIVPSDVKFLRVLPTILEESIIDFSVLVEGISFSKIHSNADWHSDTIYMFQNKPEFRITGNYIQNKTVELQFNFLFRGAFSPIQERVLDETHRQKQEIATLYKTLAASETEYENKLNLVTSRYTEVIHSPEWKKIRSRKKRTGVFGKHLSTKGELASLVEYNIESVEVDPEVNVTIIKGWGFSKRDFEQLSYHIQADEGALYKVTPLYRPDVNDIFEIDNEKKYGFILEIENYQISRYLHLSMITKNEEVLTIRLDRKNPENLSKKGRVRRVLETIRRNGLKKSYELYRMRKNELTLYDVWIEKNEAVDREKINQTMAEFTYQPTISIVVPVYNVEEKWLHAFIQSLKNQYYPNWELCIADDASTNDYIVPLLKKYMAEDSRIKVVFREQNGHISEATNSAIHLATGEYIGFMDNDDELAPNALYEVVAALNRDRTIDFIYTDEDKMSVQGKRFDPFFKPDWNPELLLGHNYITHFVVVEKSIITNIGGLRSEFNGSQDYDFVLRATEAAKHIYHIPKILYHWRTVETSVAFDPQSKEYAYIAGQHAIETALERREKSAEVTMTKNYGAYKIDYANEVHYKVSIILSGSEEKIVSCARKIFANTHYPNFEVILPKGEYAGLEKHAAIVFTDLENLNGIAKKASGKYLVFLNATLTPVNNRWLDELLNATERKENGAVGGKQVNNKDVILNAGITLAALQKGTIFEQRGVSNKSIGYYFRNALPRNLYAVTEDFLAVRREYFEAVGGFDLSLPAGIRGIDLCNRLGEKFAVRTVWTPYAVMMDDEGKTMELNKSELTAYFENQGNRFLTDSFEVSNHLD